MEHNPKKSLFEKLFRGLNSDAQARLVPRDYSTKEIATRLETTGVDAGELVSMDDKTGNWIAGLEVFSRRVFHQRHRGFFAEFARMTDGVPEKIGFWPQQWATARMYAGSAKGFHIHPPYIADGVEPAEWFQKLYVNEPENYALRPYDKEQWDMMFFIQGIAEMFLVDEREGMPRNKMRFIIEGDDLPGPNNVGVVIPPGVSHAIRCASSSDLIMVYGTSTTFNPDFEGRIADSVEKAELPAEWADYFEK